MANFLILISIYQKKNCDLSRVSGRLMNNMFGEIQPEDGGEDKEEEKEVEVALMSDRNKNNQEYFKLNNF